MRPSHIRIRVTRFGRLLPSPVSEGRQPITGMVLPVGALCRFRRATGCRLQLPYPMGLTGEQYVAAREWRNVRLERFPKHSHGGFGFARDSTYSRKTPCSNALPARRSGSIPMTSWHGENNSRIGYRLLRLTLQADAQRYESGFDAISVYDVSHLGRFQNTDQMTAIEFACQEGKSRDLLLHKAVRQRRQPLFIIDTSSSIRCRPIILETLWSEVYRSPWSFSPQK